MRGSILCDIETGWAESTVGRTRFGPKRPTPDVTTLAGAVMKPFPRGGLKRARVSIQLTSEIIVF